MPSKLKKAIAAVKDQTSISLAKVASNSTSNLEVAVLKATTHDDVPVDDRYVHDVVRLVSSSKIYAAACARAIGKRISRTRNWVVVLKSLMLVLRIFQDGDPYFPREVLHAMKRGARILNLSNFRDDSNSSPWDFTAFVRTFALYLDERLDCFLTGKLQRRYRYGDMDSSPSTRRSFRPNDPVRDMKPAMLLDRIAYWQRLLERAIATRPTGAAKTNRLVQISLYAIVQESFDLYKDISDGLALLLDSFFHLQYQNCINAFQTCVKASKQFEELSAFYSTCKTIGVGRTSEYPSVQTISEELIETLQEFLKDRSSFPATTKSPNRPRLLLPPASRSGRRHDSYGGQSEFSATTKEAYSEMTSEFGSQCTSLEDLISATETGKCPAISIDLEAYSDQFEKQSQRDSTFKISDSGSTRSLPVSNSMFDLLSLGDWSIEEDDKQGQEQVQKEKKLDSIGSNKGWDMVLSETLPSSRRSSPNVANDFNVFPEAATPTPYLPNVSNRFNGLPKPATTSAQSKRRLRTNSFSAFPDSGSQSVQSGRPLRTHSLDTIPDSATPSTQFADIFSANSFNAFPELATPSTQPSPDLANNFNTFFSQGAMPSTHPSPAVAIGFNAFPESTMPPISSVNAFPQTTNTSPQPFSNIDHNFHVQMAHSFNAFQDQFQRHVVEEKGRQEASTTGWELALVETTPPSAPSTSSFQDQAQRHMPYQNDQQSFSRTGWELALVETTATTTQSAPSTMQMNNNFNMSVFNNPYNQSIFNNPYNQSLSLQHHYNPFLQDAIDLPTLSNAALAVASSSTHHFVSPVANTFSPAPTFQATPTFSVQNPNSTNHNDPFAVGFNGTFSSEQMFSPSMNQQNFLREQQLWLQNQNKIIAKHRV